MGRDLRGVFAASGLNTIQMGANMCPARFASLGKHPDQPWLARIELP